MRDYEVVYILKSSLTGEDIEGRLDRYHQKILAHDGAEITAVEHWGKRQLAYPIDGNENGYYVVAQFTTAPSVLPEYERVLKLDDGLLRHLVVLSEGQLPTPPSMQDEAAANAAEPAPEAETGDAAGTTEESASEDSAADEPSATDESAATEADEEAEAEAAEETSGDAEEAEADAEEETVRSEES